MDQPQSGTEKSGLLERWFLLKISVLIGAEYTELAVRSLHSAYGLDAA